MTFRTPLTEAPGPPHAGARGPARPGLDARIPSRIGPRGCDGFRGPPHAGAPGAPDPLWLRRRDRRRRALRRQSDAHRGPDAPARGGARRRLPCGLALGRETRPPTRGGRRTRAPSWSGPSWARPRRRATRTSASTSSSRRAARPAGTWSARRLHRPAAGPSWTPPAGCRWSRLAASRTGAAWRRALALGACGAWGWARASSASAGSGNALGCKQRIAQAGFADLVETTLFDGDWPSSFRTGWSATRTVARWEGGGPPGAGKPPGRGRAGSARSRRHAECCAMMSPPPGRRWMGDWGGGPALGWRLGPRWCARWSRSPLSWRG